MKHSFVRLLLPACLAAALCAGCAFSPQNTPTHAPLDITPVAATPTPTPEPTPTPTPTPTPEPTPTPTPTPEPTAYQSVEYPLTPQSLRTNEGGRYPEEERLNEDPDKFYTVVDLTNQAVFVYEKDEAGEYTVLVREMICSSGIEDGYRSPRGTFKMGEDYKRFAFFVHYNCYAQYWSQIRGRIYFHSVPYSERDDRYLIEEEFWLLGQPASHGCIRLLPDDAQWVYLYLCPGSTVTITDELPADPELVARLLPKETPTPDCYEIAKKN